jgi:hypothetical protein
MKSVVIAGSSLNLVCVYLSRFAGCFWIFAFSLNLASAHDPYETSAKAYLRTNHLELRLTLTARTAEMLMAKKGITVSGLAAPAIFQTNHPALKQCAAELFRISAAGKPLIASNTNAVLAVEDHIEIGLMYPRPGPGLLRFEAILFSHLPADEPYGAELIVLDLAENVVLGQKLLTAAEPLFEAELAPQPSAKTKP